MASFDPALARNHPRGWQEYRNVRFGTSVVFPPNMFRLQSESDNGDGATFATSDGAQLKVFGSHNALDHTPAAFAASLISDRSRYARVTYRAVRQNWIVLSGTRRNSTFYERYKFENGRNIIHAAVVQYPSHLGKKYDVLAAQIVGSLHR